jgi:hypothetical protein
MSRLLRLALLAFGIVWAAAVIGALLRKSQVLPMSEPDEDEIELSAIFAPLAFRSTAQHFRGGSLEGWFGGGMVDLRGATIDPAGATIMVRAIFGGAQLIVPPSWRVVTHSRGLGGVGRTDGRTADDDDAGGPTLTIDATTLFGGVSVSTEIDPGAEQWLEKMLAAQA